MSGHKGITHIAVVAKTVRRGEIGVHRWSCSFCEAVTPMPTDVELKQALRRGRHWMSPTDDETNGGFETPGWLRITGLIAHDVALMCPACAAEMPPLLEVRP